MEIDEKISVRLPKRGLNQVDNLVIKQKFASRSEFIRVAMDDQIIRLSNINSVQVTVNNIKPLIIDNIDMLVEKKFFTSREAAFTEAVESYFDANRINLAIEEADRMKLLSKSSNDIIQSNEKTIIEK